MTRIGLFSIVGVTRRGIHCFAKVRPVIKGVPSRHDLMERASDKLEIGQVHPGSPASLGYPRD
jgi:hypothetical protein